MKSMQIIENKFRFFGRGGDGEALLLFAALAQPAQRYILGELCKGPTMH